MLGMDICPVLGNPRIELTELAIDDANVLLFARIS
jgi:hypothetical protein